MTYREEPALTIWLCLAVTAIVLGSPVQFGYNMGVINAPIDVIKNYYQSRYQETYGYSISENLLRWCWGLTVGLYAIGGMFGSVISGILADTIGRKPALMLNNCVVIVAGIMMFAAKYIKSFPVMLLFMVLGRFAVGCNAGANTIVAPMYTAEIAPVHLRGTLGTLFQFGVVLSLVTAQFLGMSSQLGNEENWNILLGIVVLPAGFQAVALSFCPDSPSYYLINRKDIGAAKRAICKFFGRAYIEMAISEIRAEDRQDKQEGQMSLHELLTNKVYREPLQIAFILPIAQQLSGINAVNFYSVKIFETAGLTDFEARWGSIGTGVSQFLMIMPAIFLMDRAGRRTLLLYGVWGMGLCSGLVVIFTIVSATYPVFKWAQLASVFGIMGSFSMGPGPIPWLITAELFTQGARSTAMSIAGAINWIMTFFVGLVFESIMKVLDYYTFTIFVILDYMFWLFVFLKVPETKNRCIEDIVQSFRNKVRKKHLKKVHPRRRHSPMRTVEEDLMDSEYMS